MPNILTTLLKLEGDSSGAVQATEQVKAKIGELGVQVNKTAEAMQRTIAESLRQQNTTAAEATQIYRQMGISGQQAAAEIAAAFGQASAAETEAGEAGAAASSKMSGGFRNSIADLRNFRMLMYSSIGLVSFGYIISEWARLAGVIADASLALGGYTQALQDMMAEAVKSNEKQIESWKTLNAGELTQIGLIDDLHARKVAELKFEIENAKISRDTLDKQQRALQATIDQDSAMIDVMGQMGIVTRALATAWVAYKEKIEGTGKALVDEQDKEQAAGRAIIQMQRQLKDAQAEWDKATSKVSNYAKAQEHMDEVIATARVELPGLFSEIRRLQIEMEGGKESTKLYAAALENLALAAKKKPGLSLEQMGVKIPKLEMPEAPDMGPIVGKMAEAQSKLTEAQRESLPTEKQIATVKAELSKIVPDLTDKERQETAERLASLPAIKSLTDEISKQQLYLQLAKSHSLEAASATHKLADAHRKLAEAIATSAGAQKQHLSTMEEFRLRMDMSGVSAEKFSKAMGSNVAMAVVYGDSVKKAMETAAKATIASIAAQAFTWGLYYTAMGVADIFWNQPRSVADFTAAAEFFAIGAASAAIGRAIPSGTSRISTAGTSGTGTGAGSQASGTGPSAGGLRPTLAPGAQQPLMPGGGLTVNIIGPEAGAQWIADTLNKGVTQQGVKLVSSHTQRSAPVGQ